jgi:hypothetical protein
MKMIFVRLSWLSFLLSVFGPLDAQVEALGIQVVSNVEQVTPAFFADFVDDDFDHAGQVALTFEQHQRGVGNNNDIGSLPPNLFLEGESVVGGRDESFSRTTVINEFWLEAECAEVGSAFQIDTVVDANVSGGMYSVYQGDRSTTAAPADISANRIRFVVENVEAGSYKLFARVAASSPANDSYWIRINGGSWTSFNGLSNGDVFNWYEAPTAAFSLPAGTDTIDFAYREPGAKLDKVYLALDGTLPAGLGTVSANCENSDTDTDGDGVSDDNDNCPTVANADQVIPTFYADGDNDGFGDPNDVTQACEAPVGYVTDNTDNCPDTANANQADTDNDGEGDACEAPPSSQAAFWLEAECAEVGSAFQTDSVTTTDVSGGMYSVYQGANSTGDAPEDIAANRIRFFVEDVEAGQYKLFARVAASTPANDSYWIRIGGGSWTSFNSLSNNDVFTWYEAPYGSIGLADGDHTIDFAYREAGAKLDKIYFVKDGSLPTGLGPVSANCENNDPDTDGDGVTDVNDNCPTVANADQVIPTFYADGDNDGFGDPNDFIQVCEAPGGYVADNTDNCPDTANADQTDTDNDGIGDACEAPPSNQTAFWLEAECAEVGSAFQTDSVTTADVSGGMYSVYQGANSTGGAPQDTAANRIRFVVEDVEAGQYKLFARVAASTPSHDSYWIRINGGSWTSFNGLSNGDVFTWYEAPSGLFPLSEGLNTIDFAYREAGAKLDKIYLAVDGVIPSGLGPVSANCGNGPDADEEDVPEGENLALLSMVENGNVYLRWVPTNYSTWERGNRKGYAIRRYKYSTNGTRLTLEEMDNSEVQIATGIFPLSEGSWAAQFPNNDFATVAKESLYNTDGVPSPAGTGSLADAVNQEQYREGRHLFGLFAAEQDFAVAQAMGLGYLDQSVSTTDEYIYYVDMQGYEDELKASALVDVRQASVMPTPPQPTAEYFDKGVVLEWPIATLEEFYGAYDIERSADGGPFLQVNEHPFFFAAEEGARTDYIAFRDSLDNNSITYQYRIKGRTPFGTNGPASPSVMVKGKEPALQITLSLGEPEVLAPNAVKLSWNDLAGATSSDLQGFRIFCAKDPLGDYVLVNQAPISPTAREYIVNDPVPTAYYRVEAFDNNDYRYLSPSTLVQMPDASPPAVPVGLTGRFITSSRVEMSWDLGTEEDLNGYRIFASNRRGLGYTQITTDIVVDTSFVYEIDPQFIVDSIYFTVLSTDHRENNSDQSVPLALARPDIVPPASPILYKVSPTPAGTEIGFRFSSSPDVDRHVLERKRKNAPGWVSVLTVQPEEEDQYGENLTPGEATTTCFIDDASLERRPYEYRFLAYDESGNVSSSEPVEVTPYDDGLRGAIEPFTVTVECTPAPNLPFQAAYNLVEWIREDIAVNGTVNLDSLYKLTIYQVILGEEYTLLKESGSGEVYEFLNDRKLQYWGDNLLAKIELNWQYVDMAQLQDFQIFRSAEGSALQLYQTLTPDQLENGNVFVDEDVKSKRRYLYQMIARHLDGGFSERSEVVMVKVP